MNLTNKLVDSLTFRINQHFEKAMVSLFTKSDFDITLIKFINTVYKDLYNRIKLPKNIGDIGSVSDRAHVSIYLHDDWYNTSLDKQIILNKEYTVMDEALEIGQKIKRKETYLVNFDETTFVNTSSSPSLTHDINLYLNSKNPHTSDFDEYVNRLEAFESARVNLITILEQERDQSSSIARLVLVMPPIKYFLTREGIDI